METNTFPGRYESLADISEFVLSAAKAAGLDENASYAVQTAVDEACSNIIEHAYGGEGKGDIVCSVSHTPQSLTIVLKDFGRPFNPKAIREPDIRASLKRRKEGGLGLFFIRKLMDEVHFEFSPEKGNQLTMVKRKEKVP
jgi:serine/threonine-protein kinase RsbW